MSCRLEHRPEAGKLEDGLDPGVVVGAVETPKAVTPFVSFQRPPKAANSLLPLSERQVANHIECRVIVPSHDVHRRPPVITSGPQLSDQQVDILLDDGLLLAHAAVTESMGHGATQHAVLLARRIDDIDGDLLERSVELEVLLELGACPVAHDVFPGAGMGKGKLVGGDAHHRTVFLVEFEHVEWQRATHHTIAVAQARRSHEQRTWVPPQWMEEEVVDRIAGEIEDGLLPILSVGIRIHHWNRYNSRKGDRPDMDTYSRESNPRCLPQSGTQIQKRHDCLRYLQSATVVMSKRGVTPAILWTRREDSGSYLDFRWNWEGCMFLI